MYFEQFASSFDKYSRKAALILQKYMVEILVECGSLFILMKYELRTNGNLKFCRALLSEAEARGSN